MGGRPFARVICEYSYAVLLPVLWRGLVVAVPAHWNASGAGSGSGSGSGVAVPTSLAAAGTEVTPAEKALSAASVAGSGIAARVTGLGGTTGGGATPRSWSMRSSRAAWCFAVCNSVGFIFDVSLLGGPLKTLAARRAIVASCAAFCSSIIIFCIDEEGTFHADVIRAP